MTNKKLEQEGVSEDGLHLKHCATCNQMTNHKGGVCGKHEDVDKPNEVEEIVDKTSKPKYEIGDRVEAVKSVDYDIGWKGTISYVGENYVNVDWDNEHNNCFVSFLGNLKKIDIK